MNVLFNLVVFFPLIHKSSMDSKHMRPKCLHAIACFGLTTLGTKSAHGYSPFPLPPLPPAARLATLGDCGSRSTTGYRLCQRRRGCWGEFRSCHARTADSAGARLMPSLQSMMKFC